MEGQSKRLAILAKNEASDLTAKERTALGRIADQLIHDFRRTTQ
jgi:hypothetical protein